MTPHHYAGRNENPSMPEHSPRGARTVSQLAAFVLIGLLGARGLVLAQTFEVVTSFGPAPNGQFPHAGLIQASDGNFYGTTNTGGASAYGTVFKLDAAGTLTTLHSFTGADGSQPEASHQ